MSSTGPAEHPKLPFRYYVEYTALRLAAGLFRLLPLRAGLTLACGLAWIGHVLVRWRREEACRRIREVMGPSFSEQEVRRTAWLSFRNMAFNFVEIMRFPDLTSERIERCLDPGNVDPMIARLDAGLPAIIATAHMGNWDFNGQVGQVWGYPIFFIARRQKNPLTDGYLNRMREAMGSQTLLNDRHIVRNVLRRLKQNQVLALLPDVRHRTPALSTRFLGGVANTAGGMAMFAKVAGVPIFPFIGRRIGWSRHQWLFLDPVEPNPDLDRDADIQRMTQIVMDGFNAEIRKSPEQYFWYNKRWVLDPIG